MFGSRMRRDLFIPWRQSPESSSPQSAGIVPSSFSSVAMPTDYLSEMEVSRPAVYVTFRRFAELDHRSPTTRAEFHALVRLMHNEGDTAEAEYFLRTHLLVSHDGESWFLDDAGLDLYTELFGNVKYEEFAGAICAFECQFSAHLSNGVGGGFNASFDTVPRNACFDKYRLRNRCCCARFDYAANDFIEATLEELPESDQLVYFRWAQGVWEILGEGVGTVVDEDD